MSNVIVLDSSDEEDPPAKKIKINNMPPAKQKPQTINRQIIQQQQHQPLKKVQNSIQITPIYNNNNNNNITISNSPKNNQNIVNTGLRNHLDKKNSITINSVTGGVTINKSPQTTIQLPVNKPELINNNISITRTDLSINNELNTIKTTHIKKLPIQPTSNTTPINLPNLIKNSVTVKRINSPVSQKISSPKSISPTTIGGITKKSINIQQRKNELIDPIKIPQLNKLNQQQQKNVSINNNININNNNNKEIITPVNKMPLKRKLSEKTNFEKNLEQQIAQRQQKAPPQQQTPPIKRIKPITISNKIDSKNWLNNHSPVITIDDDDDDDVINIKSPNSLQSSPKPFSVKLNNSYVQNIYSPLELVTATITEPTSPIYPKSSSTIITKSITHTITSPIEISNNNNDIDKNDDSTIKNLQSAPASSASTTPNSKIQDDNIDNDIVVEKNPMTPVYEELLKQCRLADPSSDMEKLIEKKLLKYYHCVHPDFVTSKGFRKTCELTIAEIKNTPDLVYLKIKTIVEELKTRKNSKQTIVNNEEHTTTGNAVRDDQVKKLSRGLYKLQMIIKKLEEDDVDWNNDSNSPYLKVERYKKRACEIYEKICDLTGESKHAHRLVSKPISFQGTSYPPFNKTIQTFVNRTKSFPDYLDVYRLLEFCNKQNSWDMSPDEMKAIAQDAFVKIGKLLQKRRQTDLYETVIHFTGDAIDPAENDNELNAKLNENQKHITKISTILEKFSKQQDFEAAEKQKTKDEKNNEDDNNEKSDDKDENKIIKLNVLEETTSTTTITTAATTTAKSISLSENYLNEDTIINNNNKLNSIQNPLPSTSKCSSEIKIQSVASLRNVNNNNNNNHNIVGEIVLSDDDDET